MRPYRNDRIITVIRDLYFTGGAKSFAARFGFKFDTFEERDGTFSREVPIPMLALVATAVSQTFDCISAPDKHNISSTLPSTNGVWVFTNRHTLLPTPTMKPM
jgi:hypothetical protein